MSSRRRHVQQRDPGAQRSSRLNKLLREIIAEDDRLNAPPTGVTVVEDDIRNVDIVNASMVVLNYTLQFLAPEDRDAMIARVTLATHQ